MKRTSPHTPPAGSPEPSASRASGATESRRGWLQHAAATAAAGGALLLHHTSPSAEAAMPAVDTQFQIRNKRVRQSIMGWTYNPMPTPDLARLCKEIGLVAMEGIDAKHYEFVRQLGLSVSLVSSHGFAKGPLNPANHVFVEKTLRESIDLAAAVQCKNVITFTGMREAGITDEAAEANCVESWKRVIGYAEQKKVTLCLEHLNSRDNTHPMKGHPGYFGDDVDRCVRLIQRVGSPNMKLLFDIYHVQIMHGDVIRRIRQYKEYIAHYHTAGAPGRGELDDTQEIHYPGILRAILETGYDGYIVHEFLPTWPDRALALRHAAQLCDLP